MYREAWRMDGWTLRGSSGWAVAAVTAAGRPSRAWPYRATFHRSRRTPYVAARRCQYGLFMLLYLYTSSRWSLDISPVRPVTCQLP